MHKFTVSLRNNTFLIGEIEFTVRDESRGYEDEFYVFIDGGFGYAEHSGWVEMDGDFCVKGMKPDVEVADRDTEFEVTITAQEFADAQSYRAEFPLNPPE